MGSFVIMAGAPPTILENDSGPTDRSLKPSALELMREIVDRACVCYACSLGKWGDFIARGAPAGPACP